jgi:hypothetical protein
MIMSKLDPINMADLEDQVKAARTSLRSEVSKLCRRKKDTDKLKIQVSKPAERNGECFGSKDA